MTIVKSISHLKKLSNINGFAEFYIILAGGLFKSGKRIMYDSNIEKFIIHNEIDDVWQDDICEKELFNQTNIPDAIKKKSLIYVGFQLQGLE
jgi:hypothetical protein